MTVKKRIALLLAMLAAASLGACSMMQSSDPSKLAFDIPDGSKLVVTVPVPVPAGQTHAIIQSGKFSSTNSRQDYEVSCRMDYRTFGPRDIAPETYRIRRIEDGWDWVSQPSIRRYYTEIHLDSDKGTDIIKMVCQQYGDTLDNHFTVAEMQATLGDIARFSYPAASPATATDAATVK